MSGFAGEVTTGRPPDREAVDRMVATLQSRGPDGHGSWADGPAAMGHRRLALIGTEESGAQPMVDYENGVTIVFDGSIYNYVELRDQLGREGYNFASSTDTEIILKAHDHWGHRCAELFAGTFAYVLFEHYSGRLFLVRDRLGLKPLYLAEVDGALRFASTLPALLAGGGVDTDLDPIALHHYLTWGAVPAPRTIVAGVDELPPATVMIVTQDGRRVSENYWRPYYSRHPRFARWEPADWGEAFLQALDTAVQRRMVADVPVGVLRRGRLESGLILALLAEGNPGEITTFVPDEICPEQLLGSLDGAIAAMSEPIPSSEAVALFLQTEEVARSHKVVQTGDGARDVFAGYPALLEASGTGAEAYHAARARRSHAEVSALVHEAYRLEEDPSRALVDRQFGQPGADGPVDAALRFDAELLLGVGRLDNMTMAWGVDARAPFLDHEVVELAAVCPPELKQDQAILKTMADGLLGDGVADEPPAPSPSIEGPVLELYRETFEADPERGLFTPDGCRPWDLALLELWLRKQGL